MFTIRKATSDDCKLINELANQVFPATYKEILSTEQLDYMMEWMYSPGKPPAADGRRARILHRLQGRHSLRLSLCPARSGGPLHPAKNSTSCPDSRVCTRGASSSARLSNTSNSSTQAPCRMELHVNRHNKAVKFYERMGMRKLREGDFEIGGGFYMNDYIMGLEI